MQTSIGERRFGLGVAMLLLALQALIVSGAARSHIDGPVRALLLGVAVLVIVTQVALVATRWRQSTVLPYAATFVGTMIVAGLCAPLILSW